MARNLRRYLAGQPDARLGESKRDGWHIGGLVGTKIADETSVVESGDDIPGHRANAGEVLVPTTVPFLLLVTGSLTIWCQAACPVTVERRVDRPDGANYHASAHLA